jgi:hypothetical protein
MKNKITEKINLIKKTNPDIRVRTCGVSFDWQNEMEVISIVTYRTTVTVFFLSWRIGE